MAVTYTSTMQQQFHRELVTFSDMYGATSKLYVYASQVANRQSLIDVRVATMTTNETNMTSLLAAAQAPTTPPPAGS